MGVGWQFVQQKTLGDLGAIILLLLFCIRTEVKRSFRWFIFSSTAENLHIVCESRVQKIRTRRRLSVHRELYMSDHGQQ